MSALIDTAILCTARTLFSETPLSNHPLFPASSPLSDQAVVLLVWDEARQVYNRLRMERIERLEQRLAALEARLDAEVPDAERR